jgi:hypothetical protein
MEEAAAANIKGHRLGRDIGMEHQAYEYLGRKRD